MAKKPTPPPKGRALRKGEVPKTPDGTAAAGAGRTPVQLWTDRLALGKKDFEHWETEYEVPRCRKYYLGKHWKGLAETEAAKRYVINMIFATVETQLPSLLFSRPKVTVEPRPARAAQAGSDAGGRATLIESTLQTFVDNRDLKFTYETTLALRNAFWSFGLVEVGYTADWIDNPNADKPMLKEKSDDPILDGDGNEVKQAKKILKKGSESLFVKRLNPQHFRCGPGRNNLLANDWVAYYDWFYVEDVQANPDYQHTGELKPTGTVAEPSDAPSTDPDRQHHEGQVKLWKIWDLRTKARHVLVEGHDKLLQEAKPFTYLPLAVLKFFEIDDSFYPLPPVYNWISPQDEVNEVRDSQRTHRKRFVRRYMREPQVTPVEFAKLETGEDGVCIEVQKINPPPIAPIPDADLSAQNTTVELALSKDDFNVVAGVSGEARGVPQSDTATQANIINVREQLREARGRTLVADWLAEIVRLMMLTIKDKMQGSMMVRMNIDPYTAPQGMQTMPPKTPGVAPDPVGVGIIGAANRGLRVAEEWKEIQAEHLGDLDVDVKIDIASLSPVAEDAQRASWNVVLQLCTNQPLLRLIGTPNPDAPDEPSPMFRKTLTLNGIKSDQEIREMWRIVQQVILEQKLEMAMMAAMKVAGGAGGGMPMIPSGASTPSATPQPGATTGSPAPGPTALA